MFLDSITKWFVSCGQQSNVRRIPTTRLRLESLEGREVPAPLAGLNVSLPAPRVALLAPMALQSQSLGKSLADHLSGKINKRLGGGECAHMVSEGLRAVGGDFTRTEPTGTTDYVWSSNRVARLTNGSQLAGKRFQVGDIIQYQNATFSSGGPKKLAHHTQVVAAVNANGRITMVYEQNFASIRKVRLNPVTDLTKLNGGSVSIYRPVARTTQAGLLEYTIVNNTNASRTCTLQIGTKTSNTTLTKVNTAGSYGTKFVTFSGNVTPTLKIGNSSVKIQNGAAYELYTMSNGLVGIRKI